MCNHTMVGNHLKPLHCLCCGERVIDGGPPYIARSNMRHIRFSLSNGATTGGVFCVECAREPFTNTRLTNLKQLWDDAFSLSAQGAGYMQSTMTGSWERRALNTKIPLVGDPEPARAAKNASEAMKFHTLRITKADTPEIVSDEIRAVLA